MPITPPSYPARPVNGGPLPKALPKSGDWCMEAKYNGWRALVHNPTGAMFNRKLEPLSIGKEFAPALGQLKRLPWEWSDVEALERRHDIGRGSLILLDYLPETPEETYRQRTAHKRLCGALIGLAIHKELSAPIQRDRVYLPMVRDIEAGLRRVGDFSADVSPEQADWQGLWDILQQCNVALGCPFWEGVVAKRDDSPYPRQRRSPEVEFPFWMKHRWAF